MPAVAVTKCGACNGRGYTWRPHATRQTSPWIPDEIELVKEPCEVCGGTGEVPVCEECGGVGTVERTIHDTGYADADCECVCGCKYPGRKHDR
jgi:DnaJ-class molecular chaperone